MVGDSDKQTRPAARQDDEIEHKRAKRQRPRQPWFHRASMPRSRSHDCGPAQALTYAPIGRRLRPLSSPSMKSTHSLSTVSVRNSSRWSPPGHDAKPSCSASSMSAFLKPPMHSSTPDTLRWCTYACSDEAASLTLKVVRHPGRETTFERIARRRADHDAAGSGCRSHRRLDPRRATDTVVGR